VGYILGAVRGGTYRGLQLSFDEDQAGRSLGNLLQLHQMESLVEEGVTTYDLGMDMEYKRRWADDAFTTVSMAILSG
jgi:CelD/BcsL family acetyltransferase involved in cellulose biosynthesis